MAKYRLYVDFECPHRDLDLGKQALLCAQVAERAILGYAGDKAELMETKCGVEMVDYPVLELPKSGWKVGDLVRWKAFPSNLYRLDKFVRGSPDRFGEVWDISNVSTQQKFIRHTLALQHVERFSSKS